VTLRERFVYTSLKSLTTLLCRVDARQLSRVPERGPLILVGNHVNFLDAPVVFTRLHPRPVTGFAKAETWDTPGLRFLFDTWGAIPVRRGEADVQAIRSGLSALERGYIVGVAPEGTRSGHGRLQRGHGGAVLLALLSGAPLLPMAWYGAENYRAQWSRLRRADFRVVVGQPFSLRTEGTRVRRSERQRITDEIMYQVAALLPPAYRGYYADLDAATENYLCFSPPAESNLLHPAGGPELPRAETSMSTGREGLPRASEPASGEPPA